MDDPALTDELNSEQYLIEDDLTRRLILQIIDDSIDKLEILEKINGWPIIEANLNFQSNFVYSSRTNHDFNIEKAQENCNLLKTLLKTLYESLRTSKSFYPLKQILHRLDTVNAENKKIFLEIQANKSEYERLNSSLVQEKQCYFEKIQECTEEIGKIKDEIVDYNRQSATKYDFVVDWENSRNEMSEISSKMKSQALEDNIKLKTIQIDQEERVHMDNVIFLNELIQDLQGLIQDWNRKYEDTYARITEDIRELTEKKNQLCEKTEFKLNLFKTREDQMNAYAEHKEFLRISREEMDRRINAATKIQAWWRGAMVRKGFGPYRKKKDKKGKKKEHDKNRPKSPKK